jgi:hypothetical protein
MYAEIKRHIFLVVVIYTVFAALVLFFYFRFHDILVPYNIFYGKLRIFTG